MPSLYRGFTISENCWMNAHIINHDKTPPPDFGLLPLTLKRSGYDLICFDNSSNTDGSSTMANSCSFLSPNESLPSAQKKQKDI